jgi:hypothetical protein
LAAARAAHSRHLPAVSRLARQRRQRRHTHTFPACCPFRKCTLAAALRTRTAAAARPTATAMLAAAVAAVVRVRVPALRDTQSLPLVRLVALRPRWPFPPRHPIRLPWSHLPPPKRPQLFPLGQPRRRRTCLHSINTRQRQWPRHRLRRRRLFHRPCCRLCLPRHSRRRIRVPCYCHTRHSLYVPYLVFACESHAYVLFVVDSCLHQTAPERSPLPYPPHLAHRCRPM